MGRTEVCSPPQKVGEVQVGDDVMNKSYQHRRGALVNFGICFLIRIKCADTLTEYKLKK